MKRKIKFFEVLKASQFSIFLKLLLVIVGSGLVVILLVITFFFIQFNPRVKTALHKNIDNYCTYLAREIGSPPDTLRAKEIAEVNSIRILYKNKNLIWTTSENMTPFPKIRQTHWGRKHRPKVFGHQNYTITNPDGSVFVFGLDHTKFMEKHEEKVLGLVLVLTFVFVGSYFLIRHILNPVKFLKKGVQQVSVGNLTHEIPIKRRDELGELSRSFNEMIKRIREMIHSRDQLLLDVSHELRSPITRMKLALEFISEGGKKKSIRDDLIEMETMITEILETERLKNGHGKLELNTYNISEIIKEVSTEFQEQSPGIKLIELPDKLFLRIDADRIKIVLKNILENAIKYSTPASRPVEISLREDNRSVTIQIKDDGTGIPEEHLPYLFEPFYRVDRSRSKDTGGYGLGLNLCKKIMEAHGGKIEIFNDEGGGTTVRLVFVRE